MNCALCNNSDNLLIQVQAGSGLTLHLCPEHEDTPLFEVAAMLATKNGKLIAEIAELEALIKKLKGCENCKHRNPADNICKKSIGVLTCVPNGYKYWECWR